MQRVGILGGTFDPIHYAHLAIAEEARVVLGLSQVMFIPTAQQPLKQQHFSSAYQRLAMTKLAIADNPAFTVSTIEVERSGVSYTIDTIQALHEDQPDIEWWLIVGSDSLATLPRWHSAADLVQLAHFAILERPGFDLDWSALLEQFPALAKRSVRIQGPRMDLSATELRSRLQAGLPVRYLVPDAVASYIAEQQLYLA
ncbi:nicotinate-nucleotide adenylyltransferase [Herpetosiphon gulosus]|uniref:Probable nicotinate-nucleotide adenylyltransferase n=1 Tax=Herpetosiphon gulosus TaxID=1973496 RepID=A0ABP9WVN4_9CHLR